jgi:hypothetical protein
MCPGNSVRGLDLTSLNNDPSVLDGETTLDPVAVTTEPDLQVLDVPCPARVRAIAWRHRLEQSSPISRSRGQETTVVCSFIRIIAANGREE